MNETIWSKLPIHFTASCGKIDDEDEDDGDNYDDVDEDEYDGYNDDDYVDDDDGTDGDDDDDDHDDLRVKGEYSLVLIIKDISLFTIFAQGGVFMGFSITPAVSNGATIILYSISLASFRVKYPVYSEEYGPREIYDTRYSLTDDRFEPEIAISAVILILVLGVSVCL